MTSATTVPMPQDGSGFDVVAERLRALAGFFEDLEDAVESLAAQVGEIGIGGEQTGRCCREAGDAMRTGLVRLQAGLDELGSRALDVREALHGTARAYDDADDAGASGLAATGAEPA